MISRVRFGLVLNWDQPAESELNSAAVICPPDPGDVGDAK